MSKPHPAPSSQALLLAIAIHELIAHGKKMDPLTLAIAIAGPIPDIPEAQSTKLGYVSVAMHLLTRLENIGIAARGEDEVICPGEPAMPVYTLRLAGFPEIFVDTFRDGA
jgi:hypothetical protein